MKIRPLHDRVIVKRLEEERTSAGRHRHPRQRRRKAHRRARSSPIGKGKILEDGVGPSRST
jgi:chaperonin GroES